MFENLTTNFSKVLTPLRSRQLTESNIQEALSDVRNALIDADVAFTVVSQFIENVQQQAIGTRVARQVQPGDAFIQLVHASMVELLGQSHEQIDIRGGSYPNVILLAGLQGVGKTTTVVKLAKLLKERESKNVAVVSADVHRPAAIEQLQVLATESKIRFINSSAEQKPEKIVRSAFADSRKNVDDVLLVDTAGRLAVDELMMSELKLLHNVLQPRETLFVVDAMTGQDAALTAEAFHRELELTGVILTKADGDARGGAALSVKSITGKPIKFIGTGESVDDLEAFHPERIASRILGMGDVLSMIEEAQRKVDQKAATRLSKKIIGRKKFTLQDMREQLQQLNDMGGMSGFLDKLPNSDLTQAKLKNVNEDEFKRQCVIIDSMTIHERLFPDTINQSRKHRIAQGSGTTIQDVSVTLRKYKQMEKQMKRMGRKGNIARAMQAMGTSSTKF